MKLYLSILLAFVSLSVSAQETDTTTIQCNCNNNTVYVRFGYKKNTDTTKTFTFNKDSIKTHGWQSMVKDWDTIYNKTYIHVSSNDSVLYRTDTLLTKTFKYIPATAIGFIAHGSTLERFTNPFRFPYSDMMPDDPESTIYMTRLCTKILNAQIHKP